MLLKVSKQMEWSHVERLFGRYKVHMGEPVDDAYCSVDGPAAAATLGRQEVPGALCAIAKMQQKVGSKLHAPCCIRRGRSRQKCCRRRLQTVCGCKQRQASPLFMQSALHCLRTLTACTKSFSQLKRCKFFCSLHGWTCSQVNRIAD